MRDVSKVLSDAETLKLRALLAQTPDLPVDAAFGQEYPKMLFNRAYIELYRLIKNHPDVLVKKEAQQKMPSVIVIVHDIETEEDYLADGWKNDPNEFLVASIEDGGYGESDSRIPTGREGRRAEKMGRLTREHELRDLRRRYAELTGRRLEEDDVPLTAAPPVAGEPATEETPPPDPKRARVAAAARKASAAPARTSAHA